MRNQRVASGIRHRGQVGSVKPALISMACFGIFSLGVGIAIFGQPTNEPAAETQKASDLKATVKTFEVDTSGIVGGQAIAISGQLHINNSVVLTPSSQPAEVTAGQVYFDEATKQLRYYDGTSFQGVASKEDVAAAAQQPAAQNITNITQQTISSPAAAVSTSNELAQKNVANTFTQNNTFMQDVAVNGFTALQSTSIASLILSQPLGVASGGTGASSLASNGVIIGGGTGALSSVTAGASGLCLVSTSGSPSFQACPGGGSADAVTSTVNSSGSIAKFGAGNTLVDSLLSESGSTVNVAGNLNLGAYNLQLGNNGFGMTLNTTPLTAGRSITLPDASGVVCLQGSSNCGFAGSSGSGNYIQNQAVASQAGANFWISGSGSASMFAATEMRAQYFDVNAGAGVPLVIGNTHATEVVLGHYGINTEVAGQIYMTQGAFITDYGLTIQGNATTYMSPLGAALNTMINIPNAPVTGYNSLLSLGLVSASSANARAIIVADARNVEHQPTIAVLSPDENQVFGFSWDGSNTTANLKTSTSEIGIKAGSSTIATFNTTSGLTVNLGGATVAGAIQGTSGLFNGSVTSSSSTATNDQIILSILSGGVGRFNGTITNASDLTANRTWAFGDESGTVCLQNSSSCGFITGATANANYIQNQNGAQQPSTNFWLSGTGRADTALQAPVFDTATATALTLGGNAASISVLDDAVLAAGKSLTVTGGATGTRPAAPTEGMVYYDTTTKQLLAYTNGKWQADRSANTKIVAASNSTQAAKDAADYVADGTGDEVEINTALTAATGGKVYLMEGTYTAGATILIPNDTVLSGAGRGTLIQLADIDASDNLIENASAQPRVTIRDLRIDGQKTLNTAGTQNGIYLNGGTGTVGSVVENVEVMNFRTSGVYSRIAYTSITNVTSESNTDKGFLLQTGTHQKLEALTARSNGQQGIWIDSGADLTTVTDSKFISNSDRGVRITAPGVKFTNNTVTSQSTNNGIEVATDRTTVTGNTVTGNQTGIVITGNSNTITDNGVSSNTGTGITVGSSTNTTISSNYIGSNGSIGISVGNIVGVTVTSNTINGNADYGIQLDLTDQALIANNYISNNGGAGGFSSIRIYSGCCGTPDDNRVIDNIITDTAGTGFAILIANGSRNYLSGNTYSGTGATSISDSGTGTVYVNQLDASGNLINRGTAAMSVNTATVTSSFTLQGGMTNTQLPTPALPVITRVGTAGTTTYGYKVTALDGTGETLPSTEGTIATANATLTGANYNTITWVSIPGAVQYKIYRTTSGGTPASTGLIGTVTGSATSAFNDTGIAATTAAPAANTTGGLSVVSNIQGSNATLTGGTLTLGTTAQTGSLVLSDGSSNTATLQVGNLAGNYTYSIPVTTANDTFCMLVTANCGGVGTIGALDGGTANATGATIAGSTLYLQSASGTNPGLVNTTTQTFAGDKTFNGILSVQDVTVGAGKSIYVTGGVTGTRPGTPTEGMVYFDTTTKQLITYANGKWQASRSSSTKIVAASNSSQSAKDAADYVATGTGDQTQINSALTAAAGGTVYLMEGTYYMSAQVSVPNNTTLSGAGPGTILTIPNAQNATYSIVRNTDTSFGTNVIVRDLQIDGNRANQTGGSMTGISLANMGAGTGSTARIGSKLTNLIIKNMRQDRGISLTGSNNIISGSTFQYNEIQAINLSGSNNVITGNTFHGNQNYTINVGGSYNTVSNNLIESGASYGMYVSATNSTVAGNTLTGNGSAGMYIAGVRTTVSGNTVSSNAGIGINTVADYITVTGNTITGNTGNGVQSQSNFGTITGNTLDTNTGSGIMIYDDNNNVSSNRIHNSGSDGIQCFATCNNNSIVGNHITDTAGSSYAIQLTNFAGTPTGNYLSNNQFSGVGASSINDEGVGTIYSNQKDSSGNTINRTQGGALTIGTNTATASLTLQGGMVAGQLVAPTLSATVANVGTAGTTTYRYQVTALDGTGETVGSTIQQTTTGNATLSGSNYNTITWTAVPGAYQYSIYKCSGAGCTPLKKTTVAGNATSFNDQSAGSPVGAAPGVNTTGGATFAGGIQGSTASLSSTLTVAGATTLNGTLTGTGTTLFKNTANSATAFQIQDSSSVALFTADTSATKIVIRTLDVSYNLTVAGHIISGGSAPAIAADTAACTSPTVGVSGTDTAGTITVTTGTGCAAPGNISTITFSTAFGAAPKITLTPASAAAAGLNAYLDDATIGTASFKVGVANTPSDSTVYKWNYHAVQ